MQQKQRLASLFALCAIALAACGGSEEDASDSSGPPTAGPAPAPAPGPAPAPAPAETSATLQWSSPGDPRVQGYRVYYGTASGQYAQAKGSGMLTATTTYVVNNLHAGRTYYFAVTAYDAVGNESDYSSEVAKVVY